MATVTSEPESGQIDQQTKPPFLRRVRIRGYKSIAFCDVSLEPLTILVGRNASGKSNFLDALAFLRDALEFSLAEALKRRGGIRSILCRSTPTDTFSLEIETALRDRKWDHVVQYRFSIRASEGNAIEQPVEALTITVGSGSEWGFRKQQDQASIFASDGSCIANANHLLPEELYLRIVGIHPFSHLAHSLRYMGFHNFSPNAMRRLQKPNPRSLLERDGSNLASVLESTRNNEEDVIERIGRYLSTITESVELRGVARYGEYETVQFRVRNSAQPLHFDAASMSDGTLRVLAALVAAFQNVPPHGYPSLVGIEEPETSLHPAAMRALVDALDEATLRTQIVLTTHSAEMLDNPTIRPENLRVVQLIDGQTVIGPVDKASVEIVRQQLNTLGGLERENQLEPDLDDQDRQRQLAQTRQESPS